MAVKSEGPGSACVTPRGLALATGRVEVSSMSLEKTGRRLECTLRGQVRSTCSKPAAKQI